MPTLPMGPLGGLSAEILRYSLYLKERRSCIHSCLKLSQACAAAAAQKSSGSDATDVHSWPATTIRLGATPHTPHTHTPFGKTMSITSRCIMTSVAHRRCQRLSASTHQAPCALGDLSIALLVHTATVAPEAIVAAHHLQKGVDTRPGHST